MRPVRFGAALGLALAVAFSMAEAPLPSPAAGPGGVDCGTARIAEGHIFEGEVNRQGRLVDFHHAGPHRDRIVRVLRGPNALGVYEAEVRAFGKLKRSTFFPDAWTRERVLAAIRKACAAAGPPREGRLVGRIGEGMRIQIYLDGRGGIATAFPLYGPSP